MLTPKEVQGIIDQVNQSFADVRERLSELEAEVETLKLQAESKPKRGRPCKAVNEDEKVEETA